MKQVQAHPTLTSLLKRGIDVGSVTRYSAVDIYKTLKNNYSVYSIVTEAGNQKIVTIRRATSIKHTWEMVLAGNDDSVIIIKLKSRENTVPSLLLTVYALFSTYSARV